MQTVHSLNMTANWTTTSTPTMQQQQPMHSVLPPLNVSSNYSNMNLMAPQDASHVVGPLATDSFQNVMRPPSMNQMVFPQMQQPVVHDGRLAPFGPMQNVQPID